MSFISRFSGERRIAATYYLVASDFCKFLGKQAATVTLFLFMGVACQGVGLFLTFKIFLALSQQSTSLIARDWVFLSDMQVSADVTLPAAIFFLSVSLVAGSLLTYLARSRTLKLGLAYERICVKRIVTYWRRGSLMPEGEATAAELKAAMGLLSRDARICGRAVRVLMIGTYPLMLFLLLSCFLMFLNALWTAGILVALLFVGLILRPHFVNGAEATLLLEATAAPSKKIKQALLFDERYISDSFPSSDAAMDAQFNEGPLASNMRAYHDRLAFQLRNITLTELAGIFLIAALLAYGALVAHLPGEVVKVVTFAVAFRFLAASLRQVINAISALVRFFPSVERCCTDISFSGP